MTMQFSPQIEKAIQQKIDSGLYNSADEVLTEALNAMELQDQLRLMNKIKIQNLRNAIQEGLDSGAATPWDAEEIKLIARRRKDEKNSGAEA